jgi:hypothetical protein
MAKRQRGHWRRTKRGGRKWVNPAKQGCAVVILVLIVVTVADWSVRRRPA